LVSATAARAGALTPPLALYEQSRRMTIDGNDTPQPRAQSTGLEQERRLGEMLSLDKVDPLKPRRLPPKELEI